MNLASVLSLGLSLTTPCDQEQANGGLLSLGKALRYDASPLMLAPLCQKYPTYATSPLPVTDGSSLNFASQTNTCFGSNREQRSHDNDASSRVRVLHVRATVSQLPRRCTPLFMFSLRQHAESWRCAPCLNAERQNWRLDRAGHRTAQIWR